jgi:hypothetical protein
LLIEWAFHLLWWYTKNIFVQCKNAPDLNNNWNDFSQRFLDYLTFKYFNFEGTWQILFHRRDGRTKFDIHVFVSYDDGEEAVEFLTCV